MPQWFTEIFHNYEELKLAIDTVFLCFENICMSDAV